MNISSPAERKKQTAGKLGPKKKALAYSLVVLPGVMGCSFQFGWCKSGTMSEFALSES